MKKTFLGIFSITVITYLAAAQHQITVILQN